MRRQTGGWVGGWARRRATSTEGWGEGRREEGDWQGTDAVCVICITRFVSRHAGRRDSQSTNRDLVRSARTACGRAWHQRQSCYASPCTALTSISRHARLWVAVCLLSCLLLFCVPSPRTG